MPVSESLVTTRSIEVFVEPGIQLPDSRIVIENGAYLFVDFLYPEQITTTKWPRLSVSKRLVVDLTQAKAPILLELREPMEEWPQIIDLHPPEPITVGGAIILPTGRITAPLAVATDSSRTVLHVRVGLARPAVAVRIAHRILFELGDVTKQETSLHGLLAGIWILDVPQPSATVAIHRALGLVGPPIGVKPSRSAGEVRVAPGKPSSQGRSPFH